MGEIPIGHEGQQAELENSVADARTTYHEVLAPFSLGSEEKKTFNKVEGGPLQGARKWVDLDQQTYETGQQLDFGTMKPKAPMVQSHFTDIAHYLVASGEAGDEAAKFRILSDALLNEASAWSNSKPLNPNDTSSDESINKFRQQAQILRRGAQALEKFSA